MTAGLTKHLLIIRLSAIGDVAMAAPVVRQFAHQFPDIHFTVVSRPFLQPLFEGLPNLHFAGVDVYGQYRGWKGLWKLFRFLQAEKPTAVADIHDVLRTKIIRWLFKLSGVPIRVIKKGRREKRAITRQNNKHLHPLKTSFARYREVIEQSIGTKLPDNTPIAPPRFNNTHHNAPPLPAIGIAPFAKHRGKIYPIEKMEKVVAHFALTKGVPVFLFGAGNERATLEAWEHSYPNVQSTVGKLSLYDELALIQQLQVMITMDSANMHLASFAGTPVVSVWGATHPFAGFYGWQQAPDNAVQATIPCRPCSVFGNKPCYRGDYLCFSLVEPIAIVEKVEKIIF